MENKTVTWMTGKGLVTLTVLAHGYTADLAGKSVPVVGIDYRMSPARKACPQAVASIGCLLLTAENLKKVLEARKEVDAKNAPKKAQHQAGGWWTTESESLVFVPAGRTI